VTRARLSELAGAIDCDVHPSVPNLKGLDPYLDPYWRTSFIERGIDSFESNSYPPNAPLTARADWKGKNGRAASDVKELAAQVFDRWQAGIAICNCLYGVEIIFSEDMARAVARAVNDWIAREWLDRDPRLRASIVVPTQNVEFAVEEIERCAADRRFVQVQMLAMQETPLGRGRSMPPPSATTCRSPCIRARPTGTRSHPSAGRPIIWRTTPPMRRRSSRSSAA
jgi:predicted TIM-barrel fold metal-dependent hydrolase